MFSERDYRDAEIFADQCNNDNYPCENENGYCNCPFNHISNCGEVTIEDWLEIIAR